MNSEHKSLLDVFARCVADAKWLKVWLGGIKLRGSLVYAWYYVWIEITVSAEVNLEI